MLTVLLLDLQLLSDGHFSLDKSFLVYAKYQGETYQAALKPLLIKTGDENILVDTGIGELPEAHRKFHSVHRKSDEGLKTQLKRCGLTPENIDIVVNTHLHFDHCGNNKLFPNAKFYVQADELRYAYAPDRFQKAAYIREFFDINVDYTLLRGTYKLAHNIMVVPTHGHSVGHQSILVEDKNKTYVYCGDAAPLRENLKRRNIPGVLYRSDWALKSIDKLRKIRNAFYVYSHDNEQLTLV